VDNVLGVRMGGVQDASADWLRSFNLLCVPIQQGRGSYNSSKSLIES